MNDCRALYQLTHTTLHSMQYLGDHWKRRHVVLTKDALYFGKVHNFTFMCQRNKLFESIVFVIAFSQDYPQIYVSVYFHMIPPSTSRRNAERTMTRWCWTRYICAISPVWTARISKCQNIGRRWKVSTLALTSAFIADSLRMTFSFGILVVRCQHFGSLKENRSLSWGKNG